MNLTHALFLSALLHGLMLSPLQHWLKTAPDREEEKMVENIEFELFQASPREENPSFSAYEAEPLMESPEVTPDFLASEESDISISKKETVKEEPLWLPPQKETSFLEPSPVLEEKTVVKPVKEKISESLTSEIVLDELKESEKVKWDYCSRIRSLIENHAKLPSALAGQGVSDVVKVEITLNRDGKLIDGTPKIIEYASSRYPEINQAALEAVINAARFFTPIPKRYPKNKITFELPIRFISGDEVR